MIFEIKKSVNGSLSFVGLSELTQTLLECTYCAQKYGIKKITACLTDVATWHFMNCDCDAMISVTGRLTMNVNDNVYDDLAHVIAKLLLKGIDEEFF